MNVFVLCTGRCGSVTFSKACEHLTNYTVGHESRYRGLYARRSRLTFPDRHIEIDPRLAFYLGPLEERYGKSAFYVHLVRASSLVAKSYKRKLLNKGMGLARAWCEIMGRPRLDDVDHVIADMVAVMNSNIRFFLRDKDHMVIDIDEAGHSFPEFCVRIGAECDDLDEAISKFGIAYNRHIPPREPETKWADSKKDPY